MTTSDNLAVHVLGAHVAAGRGGRTALITPEGPVSYEALWCLSLQAAAAFQAEGLQHGDRVLLALCDGVAFAASLFGTLAAGGVVVMENPEATVAKHEAVALYIGAKLSVTSGTLSKWLEAFETTVALPQAEPVTTEAHAFWLLTSGSTGAPKAAMHRHSDFVAHIEAYAKGVLGMTSYDRTMAVSKLHFPYATGMNLLFPLAVGGSAVLFPQRASAAELQALMAQHQPTIFSTVPTMTGRLLALPQLTPSAFASLRLAVTAGEALPPDLLAKWNDVHAAPLLDGIGSAEMFHIYVTNRPNDVRPACLGKAVPGYETRVVGEDGREVAPNEVGVLWVRGPSAAAAYHGDPERSQSVFRPEGWVVTGDMFRKSPDGYHHYEGRSDDLMKVAGLYVSPLEVEAVLRQHAAVADCAVVGRPDEQSLIKPCAFLVLNEGFPPSEDLWAAMSALVRGQLLGYKVPKWWVALESLPRNDRGKVLRRSLRETFACAPLETHTLGRA